MMLLGRPWSRKTSRITRFVVSSLVISLVRGKKCVILVYRSTILKITLSLEFGRFVIKSKDIDCHGLLGIGNGVINHMDDIGECFLYNVYYMCKHNLQQIYVDDAIKIIVLPNLRFY